MTHCGDAARVRIHFILKSVLFGLLLMNAAEQRGFYARAKIVCMREVTVEIVGSGSTIRHLPRDGGRRGAEHAAVQGDVPSKYYGVLLVGPCQHEWSHV